MKARKNLSMATISKAHSKASNRKTQGVIEEIRKLAARVGLFSHQRQFLYQRMKEYKMMCESGVGMFEHNENATNNNIENSWCQKDLGSALKEKTNELNVVQKRMDEMTSEIKSLQAKCRRASMLEQETADTREVQRLENENKELQRQFFECQRKLIETKLSYQNTIDRYRAKADGLQKTLNELKSKEGEQQPSLETAEALCNINDLQNEITKYRERVLGLTADLAISARAVRSSKESISVLERALSDLEKNPRVKVIPGDRSVEETENILAEELNNASVAFEQVSKTNREFEQHIAQLNKKTQVLFSENAHLKNKEKLYEEAKTRIDMEKKRFDLCRAEIENIRARLEKQEQQRNESGLDAKLEHYKTVAKNHEKNWITSTYELKNTKETYQTTLSALEKLQNAYQTLEQTCKKQEHLIARYREFTEGDGYVEAIEDIETYRKILRCTLCDANLKNCTIIKCMHCFCMDCLQGRIKSRLRTCPTCDSDFTLNDVKRIYL